MNKNLLKVTTKFDTKFQNNYKEVTVVPLKHPII